MIKGNRYLIQTRNGRLQEWLVEEVGTNAVKIKTITNDSLFLFSKENTTWILNSNIDKLGNTDYRIIEDLGPLKD